MASRLLNHRLISSISTFKRSLQIKSSFDLAKEMRTWNDTKQFRKTVQFAYEKRGNMRLSQLSTPVICQILKACAKLNDLKLGSDIHHHMQSRLTHDSFLLVSLINLYMQCGEISKAQELFQSTSKHTIMMIGAMMKGYITNSQAERAIELFNQTAHRDRVLYLLFFSACAQLRTPEALRLLKDVLPEIPKTFFFDERFRSTLLHALVTFGDMVEAQKLFDATEEKNMVLVGIMMKAYIANNQANRAIDLFRAIDKPNDIIYIHLFGACAQLGSPAALDLAKEALQKIPKSLYSNHRLVTSVLDAIMKCRDVEYAESIFHSLINKDVGTWNAMMAGYIKNNQTNKAIDLFAKVEKPNEITYNLFFNACAVNPSNEIANLLKRIARTMPKSYFSNDYILTSLLDALMKSGDIEYCSSIFHSITKKSVPVYGAMMKGYTSNGQPNKAIQLFDEISHPDSVIYVLLFNACAQIGSEKALNIIKTTLKKIPESFLTNENLFSSALDGLIKCNDLSHAQALFEQCKIKSSSSYAIMMDGHNLDSDPWKTIDLFHQIKNNQLIPINEFIYVHVIKALSKIGDYSLAQSILEHMPKKYFLNYQIQITLIDMWGKTGHVEKAKEIFEKLPRIDRFGYTTMINSYGLNGMGTRAAEVFHQMPSELIDEITYICIINACSHSGLVDTARSIFEKIPIKSERIYTTMIDCLARASLFDEAQELIIQYERADHSPSLTMYMALLSGARNDKNSHLAQQVYDRMKSLFSQSKDLLTAGSTLLANLYASVGDLTKANDLRRQIRESGLKKKVGLSWTVVDGQVYRFRAHDQSHPRSSEIYAEVERISNELLKHGHRFDSSWITRPLEQDETIASVLCGHSERLAIAWNFVANPNTSRIQVTKNLRVCGDCHQATKLIAAIRQCDIVVRDANRIHHFYKNGQCSCNDYF